MKVTLTALTGVAVAALAACTTVTTSQAPANPAPSSSAPSSAHANPAPASHSPSSSPTANAPAPNGVPASAAPNVTDPWAVVSAYYGDIESGNYQEAWALLSSGATTGQTYQQFVNGFTCTGQQTLTELGESGDQVTFNLDAANTCTGQVDHFTGTDTVQNGQIVGANVVKTG